MIRKIKDLDFILNFISNVYKKTIYNEDSIKGQKNFINNYVYGSDTKENFLNGFEEYYAYEDNEVLGVISINKKGYIKFLFVDPKYQGLGIGKKLLGFIEELAIKNNLSYIYLDSSIKNACFYQKLGYEKQANPILNDEIWFIPMKKKLI